MIKLALTALILCFSCSTAVAQGIRINELSAGISDRLLKWENGRARIGAGPQWFEASYDDSFWDAAPGGLGYGDGDDATDLSAEMLGITPAVYLRKPFTVSASDAGRSHALILDIDYDDGFIAYLNGVEIARRNMGAPGSFGFHDQGAFNLHEAGVAEEIIIGQANQWLQAGENLLAIQVHNLTADDNDLSLIADLHIANPSTPLVNASDTWAYWIGRAEPSGGLFDSKLIGDDEPALIASWGLLDFDDSAWPVGPGGIGFGDGDDATDVGAEMFRKLFSLYMRQTFVVSTSTVSRLDPIQLTIDYDDGFVAYLNGVEIARRNLGSPGEFVPYNVGTSAGNEAGTPEVITLDAPLKLLQPGTNVFAVQVHNTSTSGTDLSMIADLDLVASPAIKLVRHEDNWRYFPGAYEPAVRGDGPPEIETSFLDWVELVNTSSVGISLFNWSLSDDRDEPDKWKFPATGLLPGEHLIVFCSGLDLRNSASGSLHSNFSLDLDGEHLGLYDASGQLVSQVDGNKFPRQDFFHSYGWDDTANDWRYFPQPTPGTNNHTTTTFTAIVDSPSFNLDPGYYDQVTNLTLSVDTPGASIYYTTNGSIPTVSDMRYTGPLSLSTNRSIRARGFLNGYIPSETVTRTYLVNQHPIRRSVPAYVIVGDPQQSLFDPFGVTTIEGGMYNGGTWNSTSTSDYNIPMQRGRPHERQASLEVIKHQENRWLQVDAGIRMAGSRHIRPRYVLDDLTGRWDSDAAANKPSFNMIFRGVYDSTRLDEKLFDHSILTSHDTIRIRGGKNDWNNPFIHDELMRRLYGATGQPSAIGDVAILYVNGELKMYYNPVQRLTEEFFRDHYQTDNEWDIMNHRGLDNGDRIAWDTARAFRDVCDCTDLNDYLELISMVDPVNLSDYMIVNCYGGTWDWPHNNWYAAREKTPGGRYGWYMWDAEGGLGTNRDNTYNSFTGDLNVSGGDSARFYRALKESPEFRILFADRLQKHFFGDGGLVQTNIVALHDELKGAFQPVLEHLRPGTTFNNKIEPWIAGRRPIFLQQAQDEGLWPSVGAPDFPTPSGAVSNGFAATIMHTNASGTIYYTLDGSDPRALGGGIHGTAYTSPIVLDRSRDIQARVLDGNTWSPIVSATYISDLPPVVITEIMYNSPNGSELEYIELLNIGTNPVSLASLSISGGITYDFATAPISELQPGAYFVIVSDLTLFNAQYDSTGIDLDTFASGRLNNDGEDLTLAHDTFGIIQTFSFKDGWYEQTDGEGFSLNIRNPYAAQSSWNDKQGWRASDQYLGSPGTADPGALPLPGSVVVNEILTHTDNSPVGDWVELYNTTTNAINLGGWYLSDSVNVLTKFKIPPNTVIQPMDYLVFSASNHFRSTSASIPFGLSELGEQVVLTSYTNATGFVTGYSTRKSFDASDKEITFGRHLRSDGEIDFVALREATMGSANAAPLVGPVIIQEIMYHPLPGESEFIKLYNVSGATIDLSGWELRDAVTYTFNPGEVIPAHGCLFLTSTNPAAFRASYGIDPVTPVLGPLTNALNNAGDDLKLYRPGDPETNGVIPYLLVDRADFSDTAPWPLAADGLGPTLFKSLPGSYGNDPGSWTTGDTNGTPDVCRLYDSDGDELPDSWESENQYDPLNLADANQDLDLDSFDGHAEYIAGTDAGDPLDALALQIDPMHPNARISFLARETTSAQYGSLNRYYRVEVHTNWPNGTWHPLPGFAQIPGQNQEVERMEATDTPKVYRLRAWLAP